MNNNNNNNNNNNKLYNNVFNNIVIKRIILNHLNNYNILYNNVDFESVEEWEEFDNKEYLNSVRFKFEYDINQLPDNIQHITFTKPNQILQPINSIPGHLESLNYSTTFNASTLNPSILTSKLTRLNLYIDTQQDILDCKLPNSTTTLNVNGQANQIQLTMNVFPSNLKNLSFTSLESFQHGCLPSTLVSITLQDSPPQLINQLSSSCANLVKLYYTAPSYSIDNDIELPNTLQHLSINCNSLNSKLPDALKSFRLTINIFENEIQFPSSLEDISILSSYSYKKIVPIIEGRQSLPSSLKRLFFPTASIVDSYDKSILPDKLESLTVYGELINQLLANQLPSSLTKLDLGQSLFNQVINVGVLPSALKELLLGYQYTQVINPSAIPQQLKLLEINNSAYPHQIKLTPSSHPYTTVSCSNINSYYDPSNTDIRVLRLPNIFTSSLSILQLHDKSKLEYLHLGGSSLPVRSPDLPTNNQIKILELDGKFNQLISLEYFQNLETIIINKSTPIITSTITTTTDKQITFNNYNLKSIILSPRYNQVLKNLHINFYQFIKYNK